MAATVAGFRVITIYAPNGRKRKTPDWDAKLAWFEMLRVELGFALEDFENVIVVGDFNVCPTPDDVYDPIKKRNRNLVSDEERAALGAVLELGFVDVARALHGAEAGYTWFAQQRGQFEANRGYRLDLVLATAELAGTVTSCDVLREWREPRRGPSDHAPLLTGFG